MDPMNSYFQSLQFYLVEQKQVSGVNYSVYAAKISSMLADGQRYVFLFVPSSMSDVSKSHISMLNWESLQTRTLQKNYDIPLQKLEFSRNKQDQLHVTKRTATATYYASPSVYADFVLLHNPKKKSVEQFPDRLSVSQALATFSCVVRLL
nr:hypothetical protein MarFTME_153 [Marseillevirus futianmevirus]